jgi:hypothetical protein
VKALVATDETEEKEYWRGTRQSKSSPCDGAIDALAKQVIGRMRHLHDPGPESQRLDVAPDLVTHDNEAVASAQRVPGQRTVTGATLVR